MSDHRGTSRRAPRRWLSSVRVRALLSLGVALGIGAVGTFAYWTDDVVISGTSFTAGTLDLQVNGSDPLTAYTTLNITNGVPGNSNAGVLTIRNNGLAPLKYTATAAATDDGKNLRGSLIVKVTAATSVSGASPAVTCAGTAIAGFATSFTAGSSFLTPGRLLAPGTEEKI